MSREWVFSFTKLREKKGAKVFDTLGLIVSYVNNFCSFKAFGTN